MSATYEDGLAQDGSTVTYPADLGTLAILVNLQDPCDDPDSLVDPGGQQAEVVHEYTGSANPGVFTMVPFVVTPSDCIITYACVSNTGSRSDLCIVDQNGSQSKTEFDASKGEFKFYSTELDVDGTNGGFQPGAYIVTLKAISGLKETTMTFQLTLNNPCPLHAILTLTSAIFTGPETYILQDPVIQYQYDLTTIVTRSGVDTLVDCGLYEILFFNDPDVTSTPDSVVFTSPTNPVN